jgi:hypothetical protein
MAEALLASRLAELLLAEHLGEAQVEEERLARAESLAARLPI